MQEKLSLLGNILRYDISTQEKTIEEILFSRFGEETRLETSIEDLFDPYLMCDMQKAIDRIKKAKEQEEKVIIFGDYDVDGVTATSLLMHLFTTLGMKVSYRLPHRVHDGYGLKTKFIDELAPLGVSLIVTVDCGSRDRAIVSYAKNMGIDIIVTDHHHVPEDMPDDAVAFLNPNRPDCSYPDKCLSGAGVAFKVVMALAREYMPQKEYINYIRESIDIAAIGTVADCMLLTGENRIIVTEGLRQIKYSRSKGIRKMIQDKIHDDLDADIFGFLIGPRLNAAGRMDTPYKAVNLILNNGKNVEEILYEIEELNTLRKQKTLEHTQSALEVINPQDNIIFYHSGEIEHGIIGIVAGRLTEKYFKPSIVLIDEGEILVASCRSPDYFSLIEILERYKDMFLAFGGHKNAAGFSIEKKKFQDFKSQILAEVNAQDFSGYKKEITIDKVLSLDEIGFKLIEAMNRFKPFGMGNPKPLFFIENFLPQKVSFLGQGREHIKLEHHYGFKIFAFGMGEYYDIFASKKPFGVVVDISEDNWNGQKGILLKVVDVLL